jgi:hypothetical protein
LTKGRYVIQIKKYLPHSGRAAFLSTDRLIILHSSTEVSRYSNNISKTKMWTVCKGENYMGNTTHNNHNGHNNSNNKTTTTSVITQTYNNYH